LIVSVARPSGRACREPKPSLTVGLLTRAPLPGVPGIQDSLKGHLNAAHHDKVISVARPRTARRVLEPLDAEIHHVADEAVQIPVRPEIKAVGAIGSGRLVG